MLIVTKINAGLEREQIIAVNKRLDGFRKKIKQAYLHNNSRLGAIAKAFNKAAINASSSDEIVSYYNIMIKQVEKKYEKEYVSAHIVVPFLAFEGLEKFKNEDEKRYAENIRKCSQYLDRDSMVAPYGNLIEKAPKIYRIASRTSSLARHH